MLNSELILEFSLDLAEQMLMNGANLERVTDTIYRICAAYRLKKVNCFSLNCFITLSAVDSEGNSIQREKCIRSSGINMVKLNRLSDLAKTVCNMPPEPKELKPLLVEAVVVEDVYPYQFVGFGMALAIASLTPIFGGNIIDTIIGGICAAFMFVLGNFLKGRGVNGFVTDGLTTILVGIILVVLQHFTVITSADLLMVCTSFVLIPGVPMVNAFRNLLSGSEVNGIVETVKVIVEIGIICGGYVLGGFLTNLIMGW